MTDITLSTSKLKYVENLTPIYKAVLDTIVAYAGRYDIVTLSQKTIANLHKISVRTVSTIIQYFKKLGLIQVKHRWKASNETVLGEAFLDEKLRSSMYNLFPQYPPKEKVVLSLSLIKSSFAYHYIKGRLFRVFSYMSPKKRAEMDEGLVSKLKGIALAIRARGGTLSNDDALALFAFEESLHDRVIQKIKHVQVKHPAAFYFSHIRELAVWEKSKINWQLVEQLKAEGFTLISDEVVKQDREDQVRYEKPVTIERQPEKKTQKRDDRKVASFAESSRRAQEVDSEQEKEGARELLRKQLLETRREPNMFEKILLGIREGL